LFSYSGKYSSRAVSYGKYTEVLVSYCFVQQTNSQKPVYATFYMERDPISVHGWHDVNTGSCEFISKKLAPTYDTVQLNGSIGEKSAAAHNC
jgi:hypothetical protein